LVMKEDCDSNGSTKNLPDGGRYWKAGADVQKDPTEKESKNTRSGKGSIGGQFKTEVRGPFVGSKRGEKKQTGAPSGWGSQGVWSPQKSEQSSCQHSVR